MDKGLGLAEVLYWEGSGWICGSFRDIWRSHFTACSTWPSLFAGGGCAGQLCWAASQPSSSAASSSQGEWVLAALV